MFNAFHVPLVDNDDDFLTLGTIDLTEKLLIFLIDHDFLGLGEEDIGRGNVPVHQAGVETLLGEGGGTDQGELVTIRLSLIGPAGAMVLESLHEVFREVHARLVIKSLPS